MGRTIEQPSSAVAQVAYVKRCSGDGLMTFELEEALRAAVSKMDRQMLLPALGAPHGKVRGDGTKKATVVAPPPGLELIAPCTPSRQSTESTTAPADQEEASSSDPIFAHDDPVGGCVLDGLTTAMIRHVPVKMSQDRLARLLRKYGFADQFDFLYMPMDARRKTNRGVAFVNFMSAEVAENFFHAFHGLELPIAGGSQQPLVIAAADVQGFEENAAKHVDGASDKRTSGYPMILRPCPQLVARVAPAPVATAEVSAKAPVKAALQPERCVAARGAVPAPGTQSRFCGYCGQARTAAEHAFCPFCGGKFHR